MKTAPTKPATIEELAKRLGELSALREKEANDRFSAPNYRHGALARIEGEMNQVRRQIAVLEEEEARRTELLVWRECADEMPDDSEAVLIANPEEWSNPVCTGWWDSETNCWRTDGGQALAEESGDLAAPVRWAAMPAGDPSSQTSTRQGGEA